MDIFRRCVEDLGAVDRLLELPHGHEIATRMFQEVWPLVELLRPMAGRDPSGAIERLVEFAEGLRVRLGHDDTRRLTA